MVVSCTTHFHFLLKNSYLISSNSLSSYPICTHLRTSRLQLLLRQLGPYLLKHTWQHSTSVDIKFFVFSCHLPFYFNLSNLKPQLLNFLLPDQYFPFLSSPGFPQACCLHEPHSHVSFVSTDPGSPRPVRMCSRSPGDWASSRPSVTRQVTRSPWPSRLLLLSSPSEGAQPCTPHHSLPSVAGTAIFHALSDSSAEPSYLIK